MRQFVDDPSDEPETLYGEQDYPEDRVRAQEGEDGGDVIEDGDDDEEDDDLDDEDEEDDDEEEEVEE
jgi:hypothetical protein